MNMIEGYHFCHSIRIRYTEIDGQMIVLNSNYLNYIVVTNCEFFRQLGIDVTNFEKAQFDIALVASNLEFKEPGFFDDLIQVNLKIGEIGNKSYKAEYAMVRETTGELLFTAKNVYVCFNPILKKSTPIPDYVRKKFQALQNT
ncbi:MAG: acyl-CoA thioesterase [Syntrophomonadaceae bacterium]|nr:acyl-CoA thioesterase [Syntrophomonadaceae bacterium]